MIDYISKNGMPYLRIGNGEPLVLIHGLGGIKENWTNQFELSDQYELIIPDLRGHGDNHELDGITIKNFAKDVLSLLNELNIESAHICGLSMGGTVAQEIYRQSPEKCLTLILVSTFHYAPAHLGKIYLQLRNARSFFTTSDQQKLMTAKTCLYSWKKQNIVEFFKHYKPNKIGYNRALEACLEVDNRCLLPAITAPTLVIGGQYDSVLPVWIQFHMHKQIPDSELVIFKNCGHIAKFEVSEQFNLTLRRFLKKHQIVKKVG
ncbi:alpha/beta hydrolase [Neobacillus cucumis]|uniref:alpha/beta fold hydrolase n=1 Tax=Neobacillus cucumis TaxID=1740721 RepID=UPI0018DF5625|nr:alpha/beta hydrolase [Neobacillus cucumis]MBI0580042.1 alpha/beta hydrolase [Neobacillus cucumis]